MVFLWPTSVDKKEKGRCQTPYVCVLLSVSDYYSILKTEKNPQLVRAAGESFPLMEE